MISDLQGKIRKPSIHISTNIRRLSLKYPDPNWDEGRLKLTHDLYGELEKGRKRGMGPNRRKGESRLVPNMMEDRRTPYFVYQLTFPSLDVEHLDEDQRHSSRTLPVEDSARIALFLGFLSHDEFCGYSLFCLRCERNLQLFPKDAVLCDFA